MALLVLWFFPLNIFIHSFIIRPQQQSAVGLLLGAVRAGDIDRQCRAPSSNGAAARVRAARRSAANAGSAMLTAESTRLNTDSLCTNPATGGGQISITLAMMMMRVVRGDAAATAVPNAALSRACYVLRFVLSDRADLRRAYYKSYGRVAVIGRRQTLSAVPEYRALGVDTLPFPPDDPSGQSRSKL